MKSLQQNDSFLKNDVALITRELIAENLRKILFLLEENRQKGQLFAHNPQEQEAFLCDVSLKIQTCYIDCQHWLG